MGIQEEIKARLAALNSKGNGNSTNKKFFYNECLSIKEGTQYYRLLPSKSQNENPFFEVHSHWLDVPSFKKDSARREVFCTANTPGFGSPCPICEYRKNLFIINDTESAKKYFPNFDAYCNVLEVDQDNPSKLSNTNPKFLKLRRAEYISIMEFIAEPDYGDLTSLETGRTLKFVRTKKGPNARDWETKIFPLPNQFKIEDPKSIDAIFSEMKNVKDAYMEEKDISFEKTKEILDLHVRYLKDPVGTTEEFRKQYSKENKEESPGNERSTNNVEVSENLKIENSVTDFPSGLPEDKKGCYGKGRSKGSDGKFIGYDPTDPACMICPFDTQCDAAFVSKK